MTEPTDRAARAVAEWRCEYPDLDFAPMEALGRLAETAARLAREQVAPVLAAHGLQPGEFDVLAALRRAGGRCERTPTELFEATMLSSGGMTARLDRLQASGLIERRPNPDDRRGTLVGLSESGRALVDEAMPAHLANQARLVESIDAQELARFSRTLATLLARIDDPPVGASQAATVC